LLLCVVVFAVHHTRDPYTQRALIDAYAFFPSLIDKSGGALGPWSRVWTALFMHTGATHLLINGLYLWVFGDRVESKLGHGRFAALFALSALAGAIAQWATTPAAGVPMVGASAAIAGVLAARLVFFAKQPVAVFNLYKIDPLPAWLPVGGWFVVQAIMAWMASRDVHQARTAAYAAHLGGFAGGLLISLLFRREIRTQTSELLGPSTSA
jgi:membrane associated rhomboid family serine protease